MSRNNSKPTKVSPGQVTTTDQKTTLDKFDVLKLRREAKKLFEGSDYEACMNLLDQLLLAQQMNAENFFQAGTIQYNQGNLTQAESFFKACLELSPHFTDASISLSVLYNDLGQYQLAADVYKNGLNKASSVRHGFDPHLESQLSVKHEELGDLYYRFERYAEAANEYDKSLRQAGLDRRVQLSIKYAKALEKQGVVSRAIEYLQQLNKQFPKNFEIPLTLGVIHYQNKDSLKAYENLQRALAINPNDEQANLYLSLLEKSTLSTSASHKY